MLVSVNEEELVGARKDFYSKAIVSNSALLRFVKVITALVLKCIFSGLEHLLAGKESLCLSYHSPACIGVMGYHSTWPLTWSNQGVEINQSSLDSQIDSPHIIR